MTTRADVRCCKRNSITWSIKTLCSILNSAARIRFDFECRLASEVFTSKTAQLKIHQEEMRQKQEQIKLELNRILVRQKELEENNQRLMKHENEIKKEIRSIDALNWSSEECEFMMRRDEDLLTIKEFAAVKRDHIAKDDSNLTIASRVLSSSSTKRWSRSHRSWTMRWKESRI